MSKLLITETIEKELFKHFFLKKSMRCGLEVECPKFKKYGLAWEGRCDFIAYKKDIFTFVEIKVSLSDFKSKNGHNLAGDKNYYATTPEVAEKIIETLPKHIGLYVWDGKELYCAKNAKSVEPLYKKAPSYRKQPQIEMLKHNIITACNTRINNFLQEKR